MQNEIRDIWLTVGNLARMTSVMAAVTGVIGIAITVICIGMRSLQNQINELKSRLP